MIKIENLSAGLGLTPNVRHINWEIGKGENWALTGAMGVGKTTLMHAINGRARTFEGHCSYPFLANPTFDARRKAIKMVSFTDTGKLFQSVNADHYYQQRYQAFDSEGHLTVENYLKEGGLDLNNDLHSKFIDIMKMWPLLPMERIKLSSGQTRKLLLCKAILGQSQILLLDNPHIGLDDQSREVFNHFLDEIISISEIQIIMSGHFRSLPESITHTKELEHTMHPKRPRVYTEEINHAQTTDLSENLKDQFPQGDRNSYNTVLEFKNVGIKYEGDQILERIDWKVHPGQKWVVTGSNGAGKSTLVSLIYGDHPQAYSNSITLFDVPRGTGESIWDIKRKIGFTSPELHMYFRYDHRAIDVVLSGLGDGFFVNNPSPVQRKLALQLFTYFGIEEKVEATFPTLSTGMQRLLFFMRAIIKKPRVLLLDEPYQGMDRATIMKCNQLLELMLGEHHTLIFISHFQDEIPAFCNHVLSLE